MIRMHLLNFPMLLCTLVIAAVTSSAAAKLEVVNDSELLSLIKAEQYVLVLFSKKDCEACDTFENELTGVREDMVDSLNAWVVKAVSSQLIRLYSPTGEPALVFFRHGVPMLYDGQINEEIILHVITNNKEPTVKELNDENFEHLTQAATGATTGDWFVMFYTTECTDCQRLQARWEAVGARLKSKMNVARVNKGTTGGAVARRFEIQEVPSFILLRQGKVYRYTIRKYDTNSFVSFAESWYKNAKGEAVPLPKSGLDDLTALVAEYFRENSWLWQLAIGMFIVGLLASLVMKRKVSKQQQKAGKKSK